VVLERLLYSRKFLGLILFLLYIDIAYVVAVFNENTIITSTIFAIILLGYLAYYAHRHRSAKEVLALTTFISITIILGVITGLIVGGYKNIGASIYGLTLMIGLLIIMYGLNRLYKI
jgi:hypothetical protein